MPECKGFYSIIQYCPNISRLEVANIGVLLFVPELRFVEAKMSRNNNRARAIFGRDAFDNNWLKKTKAMFSSRIHCGEIITLEEFNHFKKTRMNNILITSPKPIRVRDPLETLESLFSDVVEKEKEPKDSLPKEQTYSRSYKRLEDAFERRQISELIDRNHKVYIPEMQQTFTAPFAYQNGRLNLIQPQEFNIQNVRTRGSRLSMDGICLHKDKIAELTVIPDSTTTEVQEIATSLLEAARIKIVLPDHLEDYADKIANEAHR